MNVQQKIDRPRIASVSQGELERRWKLVRDRLKERNIDALIAGGSSMDHAAHPRWLTDSAVGGYRKTVIFHRDGPMSVVQHGDMGMVRQLKDDPNNPGIGEIANVGEFPGLEYTQTYHGEATAKILKQRGYKRIALVQTQQLPYGFVAYLQNALKGAAEIVDETEFLDMAIAIKSAEEIEIIRATADMQDTIFQRVLKEARPGMRNIELAAAAHHEGMRIGSAGGIYLSNSAPMGSAAMYMPTPMQGRTMQAGDNISFLIENSNPHGYFCELGRCVVLGKASAQLLETAEKTKAAQQHMKAKFKPGAPCADVFADYNAYARANGLNEEHRINAHGQGYNLVERPLIRSDETMNILPGMLFAIHPTTVSKTEFFTYCDNYMVEANGLGACLHKTEQKVFEV